MNWQQVVHKGLRNTFSHRIAILVIDCSFQLWCMGCHKWSSALIQDDKYIH